MKKVMLLLVFIMAFVGLVGCQGDFLSSSANKSNLSTSEPIETTPPYPMPTLKFEKEVDYTNLANAQTLSDEELDSFLEENYPSLFHWTYNCRNDLNRVLAYINSVVPSLPKVTVDTPGLESGIFSVALNTYTYEPESPYYCVTINDIRYWFHASPLTEEYKPTEKESNAILKIGPHSVKLTEAPIGYADGYFGEYATDIHLVKVRILLLDETMSIKYVDFFDFELFSAEDQTD